MPISVLRKRIPYLFIDRIDVASDIIEAILDGPQPRGVKLAALLPRLPFAWEGAAAGVEGFAKSGAMHT